MTRLFSSLLLAAAVLGGSACTEDKYDYKTWTKKLDDQKESERAVDKLVNLGNPDAIPALGAAWKEQGKPVRFLQAIINLARELTPKQADDENITDYMKEGRKASWDKALPFLKEALDGVDDTNPRSIESAEKAADALGLAKLDDGLDSLIGMANKPISKKLIQAQIRAIHAMGKFDGAQKTKAAEALIKIIEQPAPDNPRTAKDKDTQRAFEEKYGLYLGMTGAAINALSELRYPNATKTLVKSLFRTPELFTQLRRALVASGPSAEEELRKVVLDQSPEIKELFKANHYDTYCGDKNNLPSDQCLPVSAKDFYPSVVLGDFYSEKDVPVLLEALKRPALPVYYLDEQPSPNTQYNALFDALRKIGSEQGAEQVHSIWAKKAAAPARGRRGAAAPEADAGADLETRKLAIGAYPFMVRGDAGTAELGAIAADNDADQFLRTEAATAFARLSHSKGDVVVLQNLAAKYFDASDKKKKESLGKPKADADAADKELAAAKKKFDEVKQGAVKIANDKNSSDDQIRKAADDAKSAEEAYKEAKKKNKAAVAPYKALERAVKDYKSYARMFQTHIARIEVAIRCKDDLKCYAATLELLKDIKKGAEVSAKNCAEYIKDIKDWTVDEKIGLVEGEVERAMLEIGKRGKKATEYTNALLAAAVTDDRLARQSILLALPKIANVPCKECEKKLAEAVKAGEGKSTLGDLNLETTMLRNYFAWAGGNTPSTTFTDDAPAPPK